MDRTPDLVAHEQIRRVKYRYLRCVDQKRWDDLAEVLTEDAVADYGTPALGRPLLLEGRAAVLDFLRASLTADIVTFHFAGQPEIEVDGDTATGTWAFEDTVISMEHRVLIRGAAYYEDDYARDAAGVWRIRRTGYVRTYETSVSFDDLPSMRLTTP